MTHLLNRLFREINALLCLCLVVVLVGCEAEQYPVPCGCVRSVYKNDDGGCYCWLVHCIDGSIRQTLIDCPCSTNIGDTLLTQ